MGTTVLTAPGCNFIYLVSWQLNYSDGNYCTYCAWMQFHSFSLVTAKLFWWEPLYLLRVDAISLIQSRDRAELKLSSVTGLHGWNCIHAQHICSKHNNSAVTRDWAQYISFPIQIEFSHNEMSYTFIPWEKLVTVLLAMKKDLFGWKLHVNNNTTLITIEQHQ